MRRLLTWIALLGLLAACSPSDGGGTGGEKENVKLKVLNISGGKTIGNQTANPGYKFVIVTYKFQYLERVPEVYMTNSDFILRAGNKLYLRDDTLTLTDDCTDTKVIAEPLPPAGGGSCSIAYEVDEVLKAGSVQYKYIANVSNTVNIVIP